MEKLLTMNDTVNVGKNKKVLVSSLVPIKGEIFKLIKKGLQFDDEVLKEAHIIKTIKDVKIQTTIVPHSKEKKTYTKETESLKNILKSINTLENQASDVVDGDDIGDEVPVEDILTDDED
jgi:hypothetical protein